MDVRRLRTAIAILFAAGLSACSSKSSSNVFPESTNEFGCADARIHDRFIVSWEDGRVTLESAPNKDVFIERFLEPNLVSIRHVEFDKIVRLNYAVSEVSAASGTNWGPALIEAQKAWSRGQTGAGVKVAVVDAAVDYSHPQLAPRLSPNLAEVNGRPGVDDDGNGLIDDLYGWDFFRNQPRPEVNSREVHGSHVAGIILADHSQGIVDGIAPGAELVPVNFMTADSGSIGAGIQAIRYAASRGARIINASWGGKSCSVALKDTIAQLNSRGILFVAAAGNDGANLDSSPEYPAVFELPNQLTIGATMASDRLAGFSNTSYRFVHLAAPGANIVSTVPGGYADLSGTSMAAPMVSGTAAVLWGARPNATLAQIRTALLNSIDVRDYRVMTRGRLNVRKALEEIERLVP